MMTQVSEKKWEDGHGNYIWMDEHGRYLVLARGRQAMAGTLEDAIDFYERRIRK